MEEIVQTRVDSDKENMRGEWVIPEHVTGKVIKQGGGLPVAPNCPGSGALNADEALTRPEVSRSFRRRFPEMARTYYSVRKEHVPNYRGAKVELESGLNLEEWRKEEDKIKDKGLIQMLTYGFPISYASEAIPGTGIRNHSSATQHPASVKNYIKKEVAYGALIGPLRDGPLRDAPFIPWTRTSPLMTRPKSDPSLRRMILDLSYPEGKSVNDGIPEGMLDGASFKMRLPTPFDLARKIVQYGPGVLLYKADLSRAYRQLRSDPLDWPFLALEWNNETYMDVAIPFGLRHGASACQRVSEAIGDIIEDKVTADTLPYIDDTSGLAWPEVAMLHYETLISTIVRLGLQPALDKCAAPATVMVWIGVTFDTIKMTMAIVPEKIDEALAACVELLANEWISLHQLQSLVGKVLHAAKCTSGARVFASRILDMLSAARGQRQVRLSEAARGDLAWFGAFLHTFNGISMMKQEVAQQIVHVDSCLVGGGGGSVRGWVSIRRIIRNRSKSGALV